MSSIFRLIITLAGLTAVACGQDVFVVTRPVNLVPMLGPQGQPKGEPGVVYLGFQRDHSGVIEMVLRAAVPAKGTQLDLHLGSTSSVLSIPCGSGLKCYSTFLPYPLHKALVMDLLEGRAEAVLRAGSKSFWYRSALDDSIVSRSSGERSITRPLEAGGEISGRLRYSYVSSFCDDTVTAAWSGGRRWALQELSLTAGGEECTYRLSPGGQFALVPKNDRASSNDRLSHAHSQLQSIVLKRRKRPVLIDLKEGYGNAVH